jgi:hypothetical protein
VLKACFWVLLICNVIRFDRQRAATPYDEENFGSQQAAIGPKHWWWLQERRRAIGIFPEVWTAMLNPDKLANHAEHFGYFSVQQETVPRRSCESIKKLFFHDTNLSDVNPTRPSKWGCI